MPLLTPLAERFKPHALLKQGRFHMVSLVLEVADQKSRVARLIQQPPDTSELELLQSIETEARLLQGLSHPNLARFDKIVEGQGGTWLFFHWAEGTPLGDYVGMETRIADAWIVWWMAEILKGLAALHQHDPPVVVGYLEPGDVVVADDRLCICDLGVFEDVYPEQAAATMCQLPFVHFIAPERPGQAQPEPSADLFSAAAIAFWLMTGHSPAVTSAEVGSLHRAAIARARPGLKSEVADLVSQALAFAPSDRPASAAAMLEQLGPHVVDMRGQKAPPFPTIDNVQYVAQTTRRVFEYAETPTPISFDDADAGENDSIELALPPTTAGWRLYRLGMLAVALVVFLAIRWSRGGWHVALPPPVVMQVDDGRVLMQDVPSSHGPPAWKSVTKVPRGSVIRSEDSVGRLSFGASHLTLQPTALVKVSGDDGHGNMGFMVFKGVMEVETDEAHGATVSLPPGNVVTLSPRSCALVDLTNLNDKGMIVTCRAGSARVTAANSTATLETSQTLRLARDGSIATDTPSPPPH